MDEGLKLGLVLLGTYFLGCISTAYYLVRWRTGEDIRDLHSGTAGARNSGRVLGKIGFILTFALDITKGALAVLLARWLVPDSPLSEVLGLSGAILGHVFPVQLSFKGGKGVSILIGALLILNPLILAIMAVIAGVLALLMRRTNQCMIITIAILPFVAWGICNNPVHAAGFSFAAIVVLFFHRSNIRAILNTYNIGEAE